MKISIFSNDKTTMKDEIIILTIILISLIAGVLLIVFRPSVWIVSSNDSIVFGVMLVMFFVIMLPSILYRFATNNKTTKEEK